MTIISYAQNFEDVMLWRALKHVKNGFYVDIGAQDPVVDSVSLAFYEQGWRGVHVEPTQQYSDRLREARPDENVMQVAIGKQLEPITFYEFQDTGLSTGDVAIAHSHQEAGFNCAEIVVPVLTLDALLNGIGAQEVHWMKLDVEGLEASVIQSWENSTLLPWILVIESTRPLTQEESYSEWEPLLLNKGYRYVYFDGLNRYYVAPAHTELLGAFNSPPNIFDGFVLSGSASQPFYKLVASKAGEAQARARLAEDKAKELEALSELHWAQLQALYNSLSWRVTTPLRWLNVQARRLIRDGWISRLKALIKKILCKLNRQLLKRPRFRQYLIALSHKLGISSQLKALQRRLSGASAQVYSFDQLSAVSAAQDMMTKRAQQIYVGLKEAIARQEQRR